VPGELTDTLPLPLPLPPVLLNRLDVVKRDPADVANRAGPG